MNKRFLILLTLLATVTFGHYKPKVSTDKWLDGNEWAIVEQDSLKVKVLCQGIKAGQIVFRLHLENNSSEDINIDPDLISYTTDVFNEAVIAKKAENNVQLFTDMESEEYDTKVQAEKDRMKSALRVVQCERQDKLIRRNKALSVLGFLFADDAVANNRAYKNIDYYTSQLLLKNTIEPEQVYSKLFFMQHDDLVEEFTLNIKIGESTFSFPFEFLEDEEDEVE